MPSLLDKLQKQNKRRRRRRRQKQQQQIQKQQQEQQNSQNFNVAATAKTRVKTKQKCFQHQRYCHRYQCHQQHHRHRYRHHQQQQQHLKHRLIRRATACFSHRLKCCSLKTFSNSHRSGKFFDINTATTTTTKTTTSPFKSASISTRRLYAAIFTLMLSIVCHYSNALQSAASAAAAATTNITAETANATVATASLQLLRDFEQMRQNKTQQQLSNANNLSTNNQNNNNFNRGNNFGNDGNKSNGNGKNNSNSNRKNKSKDYKNYGKTSNFSVALEKPHYETIENIAEVHFKSFPIADLQRGESETAAAILVDTDLQYVDSQPIFDFGMPRNITGRTGHSEAVIKCRVDMLNDKSVSWIRKRDLHILTVGTTTYTTDKRFKVTVSKDKREWTLHVKSPQTRDSGIYECQINTEPKISMAFQLNITEIPADAKAIISGPADLHFKVGSAIVLQCLVEQPTVKDIGPIYWYRGEQMITPLQNEDDDNNNENNNNYGNDNANAIATDVGAADSEHSLFLSALDSGTTSSVVVTLNNENNMNLFAAEDTRTMHHLQNDITADFIARIAMESQLGDTLKSRLRISNAQKTDTGNYTCQPTTASSASVMVHVINVDVVKQRWTTMRDYFVRSREKKTTGSAATSSKRDESLSFLLQTSVLKRRSISSLPSTSGSASTCSIEASQLADEFDESQQYESFSNAHTQSIAGLYDETSNEPFSPFPVSQTPVAKKRKAPQMNETNEILREFMSSRPKPSDFMPQKPNDDIQQFFESMAATVRKFSPLAVARIKIKIANIVGEEEILWAENQTNIQNVEYTYVPQASPVQPQEKQ